MRDDRRTDQGRPFSRHRYQTERCSLERLNRWDEALALSEMLAEMDPWRRLGYAADTIARYMVREDPGLFRFLMRIDSAPIGVLGVRYPWLRGAYIEVIGIGAAYQGSGLGSSLIDWLVSYTRSEAANLWAAVSAFNAPARRFYANHGFREVATLNELVSPGYDEILVRKRFG